MTRFVARMLFVLTCAALSTAHAQSGGLGLKTFGYFQISFDHHREFPSGPELNSFSLQQLNLFLQKDFTQKWTAFVNFEFVNSYSSFRNWGAFSLNEAWVSYRRNERFRLKLGLQVPTFNNLNEIKNRTPLLPYIIRPLVYESSFNEIIQLDEFVPSRAFVQVSGFVPWKKTKFEYAVFLGDSPNINDDPSYGQTGVDTTKTFLVGGRLGVRTTHFKVGFSVTYDETTFQRQLQILEFVRSVSKEVPRIRRGADFSFILGNVEWESEYIRVTYDDDVPSLQLDKKFYYGTLGYRFTERFFAYGSYWVTEEDYFPVTDQDFEARTFGATYGLNEIIFMKAQYGRAYFKSSFPNEQKYKSDYYFLAVSVVF